MILKAAAMSVILGAASGGTSTELAQLFAEWRVFETPPMHDGVPDYTAATFARRHAELPRWRARLAAIDPGRWPVEQQVDYELLRAELNGFDFYVRVL